jgi:dihydropteroate synthase
MSDVSTLRAGRHSLKFGGVTHVIAVINLSPESRNLHTIAFDADNAVDMARRYRDVGATIIDLGGQSSHYDNPTLETDEELDRLLPVVARLADEDFVVSVDTWKPEVAAACIKEGATIVNDTGGLTDQAMIDVVAATDVAAVMVYVEARNPHEVGEIDTGPNKAARTAAILGERIKSLQASGVDRLIIDPGIALNYRGDYERYTQLQLEVIRDSRKLHKLGVPVLVPIPRKKEHHRVLAYVTLALEYEADLIRVHDVEEACDLVRLFGRSA